MVKAHIEVITSQFEFAHGRRPRGTGSWAFSFVGPNPTDVLDPEQVFCVPNATYRDARKAALAEAFAKLRYRIWVLS